MSSINNIDTLKVVATQLDNICSNNIVADGCNIWLYIALVEAAIIIVLLWLVLKSNNIDSAALERERIKSHVMKSGDIDFGNIIDSSFNATGLYDKLKVRCHPDRFPNDIEKQKLADNIFQEITKNRTNIRRLKELQSEAIDKLNIS